MLRIFHQYIFCFLNILFVSVLMFSNFVSILMFSNFVLIEFFF